MVLAVFVWWLDRVLPRSPLIGAGTRQLVMLGVLGAAAYNVRRESIILIAVILVTQVVELVRARRAPAAGAGAVADRCDAAPRVPRLHRRSSSC